MGPGWLTDAELEQIQSVAKVAVERYETYDLPRMTAADFAMMDGGEPLEIRLARAVLSLCLMVKL
jgi:hypothetical protein